jgi:hypothetical protein
MVIVGLNTQFEADVIESDTQYEVSVYVVRNGVRPELPISVYHFDKHEGATAEQLLRDAAPHLFAE